MEGECVFDAGVAGFIGDNAKICLLIFRGCIYNKFAVFIEFLLKMLNLFLEDTIFPLFKDISCLKFA